MIEYEAKCGKSFTVGLSLVDLYLQTRLWLRDRKSGRIEC